VDIVLVRHAIAEERDPMRWSHDALRPLTACGRERFEPAARGLGTIVGRVETVLASPYVRAWDTARILSDQADWPAPVSCPELAAHATVGEALAVLVAMPNAGTAVCVGHEPNLTLLAQALLRAKDAGEVPWFKKGGALCVRFRGTVEPGRGKLHWAHAPKELRNVGG
jgi:phosphohistidine phosphatase